MDTLRFAGSLNVRCLQYPEALYPVQRYVDGIAGLKDDSRRVSFIAIVGLPPDLEGEDYDRVLDDSRMQLRILGDPSRSRASCELPGRGAATPPIRIVQVAQGLQERGVQTDVRSICGDFSSSAVSDAIFRSAGRCD